MMKFYTFLFLSSLSMLSFAQLPVTNFSELGFSKKPTQTETYTYSFEDKFVEDKALEAFIFDTLGNLSYHTYTLFGRDGSTTNKTYKYNKENLESEHTTVPKFPTFNSSKKFEYDDFGFLLKKTESMGNFGSKLYDFICDAEGNVLHEHSSKGNMLTKKEFIYKNNALTKTTSQSLNSQVLNYTEYDLYHDNNILASFNDKDSTFKVYLKTPSKEQEIEYAFNNKKEAVENFLKLESIINNKKFTSERLETFLSDFKNYKILHQVYLKLNEQGDWIASYQIDNYFFKTERYNFRKIIYSDGIISGTSDFDIFTINELKSFLNK